MNRIWNPVLKLYPEAESISIFDVNSGHETYLSEDGLSWYKNETAVDLKIYLPERNVFSTFTVEELLRFK